MKTKIKIFAILTLLLLGFFNFPIYVQATDSDIVISEIGAYETSEYEWLEIYNKGTDPVDLTNWKFYEDSTNHRLSAWQNDFIIDPGEYAVIANKADLFKQKYSDFTGTILDSSWSSLREDGEEIGLKNSASEIIENFTYLPCPDTSLQRIDLNMNDYTEINWQVHATGNSAGKANEFSDFPPVEPPPPDDNPPPDNPPPDNPPPADPPPSPVAQTKEKIISSGTLVINEFVSDPADGEVEWIELYNKNVFDIELAGWKIIDGSGAETALSGAIGSNYDNKFLVIENPKGKLNNSGDIIILKDQNNNIVNAVSYGKWSSGFVEQNAPAANDPFSTARIFDGAESFNNKNDFVITQMPTKGEPNIIDLLEEEKESSSAKATDDGQEKNNAQIVISEIYPNPIGSDSDSEWIEIKNIGDSEINLTGWQIKDNSKKTFKISAKKFPVTIIKPNEFFLIERKISGLALNNDKETIKLISPEDKTVQTVKYAEDENIPENISYVQDENGDWFWSTTPTPNEQNILTKLNHSPEINLDCPKAALVEEIITCDASDSFDLEDDNLIFAWQIEDQIYNTVIAQHQFKQKGTYSITLIVSDGQIESKEVQKIKITTLSNTTGSEVKAQTASKKTSVKKSSKSKKTSAKKIIQADLKEIKNFTVGTMVKTQGVVSVLPNIFGKTMMYIAGSGIQVYMSKASWPDLKIGDLVELNGTLSEALGEKRIKLASNQDIKVIASQDPPTPKIITAEEINNDLVGYLVQITGQLLEKNGSKFFVKDESGEAEVYLKTSAKINKNNYAEGDNLKVIGILSRNNEEYRILPRSNEDIKKNEPATPIEQTNVPANKMGQSVLKYLIATAVFLALSLAVVVYKFRKPET